MVISFYLIIALVCGLLLIVMAAMGGIGDMDMDMDMDVDVDMDMDMDIGHGDFGGMGISPLSVPVILTFATLFGGFGAIFEGMEYDVYIVPMYALGIAAAITALIFIILVKFFIKTQATTQVNLKDLIGMEAETTMPIRPKAPGQIMVITEERGRTLLSAVSDVDIPTNTMVKITGVVGIGVRVIPRKGGE